MIDQEVISRLVMIYHVKYFFALYETLLYEEIYINKLLREHTTPDEPPTWPIMFLASVSVLFYCETLHTRNMLILCTPIIMMRL